VAAAAVAVAAPLRSVPAQPHLQEASAAVSMVCQRERLVCPRQLPALGGAHYGLSFFHVPGVRTLSLDAGFGSSRPTQNRPPRFAHVIVQRGRLADVMNVVEAHGVRRAKPSNSLLASDVSAAITFGARNWRGRHGSLFLAPTSSYIESIDAGHLIFIWRTSAKDKEIVSLHAWSPLGEAIATLRALVRSLPVRDS
jgi:hypothetical protein